MTLLDFLHKHFWALWWLLVIWALCMGAPAKVIYRDHK